ncbi:hypothetical protein C9374_010864 [Naegleria lovaniensis]|uniref:Uncharacterized protein n=1 Tax=Naegleria lovaniensis TaxID=51637 RepID=A0AA88GGR4_NAELO|nr:uncharacterized protein C9374_010864 [Naegleria lovaniensis]KAG2374294.1 hypothetical protein C9374_010864 [Naegleria lovaniensis]
MRSPLSAPSKRKNDQVEASSPKLPKHNVQRYERIFHESSVGALAPLPNEMILQILSFLVGDLEANRKVNVADLESREATDQNRYYAAREGKLSEEVTCYIPPFENIKALINLTKTSKHWHDMLTSTASNSEDGETLTDFEMYWLNGYNFFEKLSYWIRTGLLDDLELGQGDMNKRQVMEMTRIQNVIQHYERGKVLNDLSKAISSDWEDYGYDDDDGGEEEEEEDEDETKSKKKTIPSSKQPLFSDAESSKAQLLKRLEKLCVTAEDYCSHFRNQSSNSFRLFIFSSLMLSLNMFSALDSENTEEYWSEGSDVLLTSNYLDSWAEEEKENYRYRTKETKNSDDGTPKLGIYIRKPSGWGKFLGAIHSQSFDPYTVKIEDINQEQIKERLKKALYLQLENVLLFQPLSKFTFPESIQFLSIEQSQVEAYTEYPETSWKELFNKCVFPGVKYLRIRFSQEYNYRRKKEERKEMPAEELERTILEALLNKETLPNLQHVALSGFVFDHVKEVLARQQDFLSSQLLSFELTFDGDSRDSENWSKWTSFTSSLSCDSCTLKRVVVETELDSRYNCDHTDMEKFYTSHKCIASIGYASISRFYYICNE